MVDNFVTPHYVHMECPVEGCDYEGTHLQVRSHIHSTDDPEHDDMAERIVERLGPHPSNAFDV